VLYYIAPRAFEGAWEYFKKLAGKTKVEGFPVVYILVWGLVMYLYELDKKMLNRSLVWSMDYIYKDSDKDMKSWGDLAPIKMEKVPFMNTPKHPKENSK